jgi:hypothetical protein
MKMREIQISKGEGGGENKEWGEFWGWKSFFSFFSIRNLFFIFFSLDSKLNECHF